MENGEKGKKTKKKKTSSLQVKLRCQVFPSAMRKWKIVKRELMKFGRNAVLGGCQRRV